MAAQKQGWYLLPRSGRRFYGPVPPGAVEVDAPEAPVVSEDLGPSAPPRPAKSATKGEWAEYVRALVAHDATASALVESLTKADLIEMADLHEAVVSGEAGEEDVDPGQGSGPVGADVAGDELGTDPLEEGTVEGTIEVQVDDDPVVDDGHEA